MNTTSKLFLSVMMALTVASMGDEPPPNVWVGRVECAATAAEALQRSRAALAGIPVKREKVQPGAIQSQCTGNGYPIALMISRGDLPRLPSTFAVQQDVGIKRVH